MCSQCGDPERISWDPIDITMPAPLETETNEEMVEYLGVPMTKAVMEALVEQQNKTQG